VRRCGQEGRRCGRSRCRSRGRCRRTFYRCDSWLLSRAWPPLARQSDSRLPTRCPAKGNRPLLPAASFSRSSRLARPHGRGVRRWLSIGRKPLRITLADRLRLF
jgi:hypothetical protein